MKTNRDAARAPRKLSEFLLRHVDLYALAASAAGVSLLTLTPPVEAEIIYTKTHQVIGQNGICDIDLTHDGTVDFLIQEIGSTWYSDFGNGARWWLFAKPALGDAIAGSGNYASALKTGADIGPRGRFINGGSNGATMAFVSVFSSTSTHRHRTAGDWANVNKRYLGLKFKIKGKFHYGWARLNVQAGNGNLSGTLTGYAYETVANRSIRAGQTKGSSTTGSISQEAPTPATAAASGATLGTLALGARNVPGRRQP